jgi:hypothetical protein
MTKLCLVVAVAAIAYSGAALAAQPMEISCRVEYFKYCPTVEAGGGRIVACLNKRRSHISGACKESMDAWVADNKARGY